MKTLFLVALLQAGVQFEAVLPRPIEIPKAKEIKKGGSKGKGKKPYFYKFM